MSIDPRLSWKDTLNYAPSCPISHGQPVPGSRQDPRGVPWQRDLIGQIPWATDLRSAMRALNAMAHIITGILNTGPHVNNTHVPKEPDIVEKGQNNDPKYANKDWIQESRVYKKLALVNPDDENQSIEIHVLSEVTFYNQNTTYRLTYDGFEG